MSEVVGSSPIKKYADAHCDVSTMKVLFGVDAVRGFPNNKLLVLTSNNGEQFPYLPGVDAPRILKAGGVLVFASACPFPYDPEINDLADPKSFLGEYRKHSRVITEIAQTYSDKVAIVATREELKRARAQDQLALVRAIEGLPVSKKTSIGLRQLERVLEDGVVVAALSWNNPNFLCGSKDERDKGLTDYGVQVVKLLNSRGLSIDVSHTSPKAAGEILDLVQKENGLLKSPVIATHCGAEAVTENNRNMPDSIISSLEGIGIPFVASFVRRNKDSVSADDVAAHIIHCIKLVGWNRVFLGPDFGGTHLRSKNPGLDDVLTFKDHLYDSLSRTGLKDGPIARVFYKNLVELSEDKLLPKAA